MKISELSDETLSRWIAEKLGWVLRVHAGTGTVFDDEDVACLYPLKQSYEIELWHRPECKCPARVLLGVCIGALLPDMVSDTAMTVMLMEKDSFVSVTLDEGVYYVDFCGRDHHNENCDDFHSADSSKLGRAVAEAFALANGWSE